MVELIEVLGNRQQTLVNQNGEFKVSSNVNLLENLKKILRK
jgi:hypothetical protein